MTRTPLALLALAAVGATEFGDQLAEAIEELDKTGIPDEGVSPNQLKSTARNTGTPGVTAVSSNGVSGFSVRSSELGDKSLVVVSKGDRVAIGYSLPPALAGLDAGSGETLSESASYKAAVSALGGTPISGFVDGPAALRLAESMISPSDDDFEDFQEAKPYLRHVEYVAMGSDTDDPTTSKLIVGLEE